MFLLGAGVALMALALQTVTLPHVAPGAVGGIRALGSTLRSGIVIGGLLGILLVFSGHFGGFTYIRSAAQSVSGIDAGGLALLLLVFGIANVLGTALSGVVADRAIRFAVLLFPAILGIGMLGMLLTGGSLLGLFIAAALWGFGFGGVPTAVLTWGARTEPDRLEQIGGLIVTVCNIAIALGAIVGGILVDRVSTSTPLLFGALAVVAGGIVLVAFRRRR